MRTGVKSKMLRGLSMALLLGLSFPQRMLPANVTAETIQAWDESVQALKDELARSANTPEHFLLLDRDHEVFKKVRSGKIVAVHPPHGGMVAVPAGLIHHWTGEIFLPQTNKQTVLSVLQGYDEYAQTYNPAVVGSTLVSHTGQDFKYRLKFEQHGFGVHAGLKGDFHSTYELLDDRTGYSITEATNLVELEKPGSAEERELTVAESHGYVERILTVVRYREVAEGVQLEVETLTLSRDVPASLRWIVSPVIQRFSRQVMTSTLEKFRSRIEEKQEATQVARNAPSAEQKAASGRK